MFDFQFRYAGKDTENPVVSWDKTDRELNRLNKISAAQAPHETDHTALDFTAPDTAGGDLGSNPVAVDNAAATIDMGTPGTRDIFIQSNPK